MLVEMVAAAELRTRGALGVAEAKNEPALQTSYFITTGGGTTLDQDERDPTAEQIKSLPELANDADERIWRGYCTEFQHYLEGTLWQANGNIVINRPVMVTPFSNFNVAITSVWAVFSPIAKAAYARAAAKVEDALMRQPSSIGLWDLWMTLHKTGAGTPMKKLLADLQPSPTLSPTNWPPPSIRQAYIKACRENEDWMAIQELVVPMWETAVSFVQMTQSNLGAQARGVASAFNQGFWASTGEAYMEALLKQGRLPDAQQIMSTWESNSGWPGAFLTAADMAEKLGYDSAAKAWRALGEKK
jgi:hypothetical protein